VPVAFSANGAASIVKLGATPQGYDRTQISSAESAVQFQSGESRFQRCRFSVYASWGVAQAAVSGAFSAKQISAPTCSRSDGFPAVSLKSTAAQAVAP
jgi:hypothetical protein